MGLSSLSSLPSAQTLPAAAAPRRVTSISVSASASLRRRPRTSSSAALGVLYTACLFTLKAYSISAAATSPPGSSSSSSSGFACLSGTSFSSSPSSSSASTCPPTRRHLMTRGGGSSSSSGNGESMASTKGMTTSVSCSSLDQPVEGAALRRPFIISGPSGVGKGTLIRRLLGEYPARFGFSCSHTTRGPRPGEQEGIDYFFTTREKLQAEIDAGKFLEHAMVHNNLYGTSFDAVREVQDEGKICVLDIDVQGVMSVKKAAGRGLVHDLRPLFVFIAPPSLEVLEKRLRGRETEKEEDVVRRLGNARKEVEYGWVEGNFDKIVVNGELDEAYRDLVGYIERMYYSSEEEEKEEEEGGREGEGVGDRKKEKKEDER